MSYIKTLINDIDKEWESLINKNYHLLISTVKTRNLSNIWQFKFREKIIREIIPPEVKILNLEFDLNFQKNYIKKFAYKQNKLTIHGSMINELQTIIPENTLCLLVDIDAYPLCDEAIKISFIMAEKKGIFGNIQRTNCINNGENLFIPCSYMCFNNKKIKSSGEKNWFTNKRSDVGEEISWAYPELIDEDIFRPIKTIFKPIWPLKGNIPVYGIGTTFGFDNIPMTYHHFFSRTRISRLHFFLISFLHYLKIKKRERFFFNKKSISKSLNFITYEIKFTIKYLLNRID